MRDGLTVGFRYCGSSKGGRGQTLKVGVSPPAFLWAHELDLIKTATWGALYGAALASGADRVSYDFAWTLDREVGARRLFSTGRVRLNLWASLTLDHGDIRAAVEHVDQWVTL